MLAGMGTTWYTWLEQARDINVSEQVLRSIANALRLDAAERKHLFVLAHKGSPAGPYPTETVSPALRRVLDGLEPSPAYVTVRRCDILA